MPMFAYTVKDQLGKSKQDIVEASSEQALVEKLQAEGFFVIDVHLALEKKFNQVKEVSRTIKFSHNDVKLDDLLVFSRQLAVMLEAGVTLLRSLDIIQTQIQSKEFYRIVKQIRQDIERGSALSVALAKHPKIFNQFWVSLAEVGEASGTMPQVLDKLAHHVEQDAAFKSAIGSAMIYPMILMFVAMGAVIFFALVVCPKFEAVFNEMHAQLPPITKTLLVVFAFIKQNLLFLIGGGFAVFWLFNAYIKTPMGKLNYEKFLFQLPIAGEIIKLIVVERFAAQMSILMDSGVPILYALEISEKMVDNQICGLIIAQVREDVRQGRGLGDSMEKRGFFPVMSIQMIKVGEETGELGKMLKHVARFYQSNVETFVKRFGVLIEPFMLVFIATIIGFIVVAVFMPLFKLGQTGGAG